MLFSKTFSKTDCKIHKANWNIYSIQISKNKIKSASSTPRFLWGIWGSWFRLQQRIDQLCGKGTAA